MKRIFSLSILDIINKDLRRICSFIVVSLFCILSSFYYKKKTKYYYAYSYFPVDVNKMLVLYMVLVLH
jgi:hypothetical protein